MNNTFAQPRPPLRRTSRRGTVYIAVLSVATLVSLLGISAITAARLRGRASNTGNDILDAQNYAQAAIDLGRLTISLDSNWRTTKAKGWWAKGVAMGGGTYSLWAYDPNGNGAINQNTTDPVILIGYGYKGSASQQIQVQLNASTSTPMSCLSVAVAGNGNMTFTAATVVGNQIIGGNAVINGIGATIGPAVQGVVAPTGGTYSSTHTGGNAALQLPATATIFSNYTGTTIPFASIPTVSGIATLSAKTFSSTSNPIVPASPDPNGIYVIDCANATLNITGCHITGTLVLKNVGAAGSIQGNNYFEPGTAGNPVLMVQGNINIKQTNTTFTLGGVTYPSQLKGITYVSGNLTTSVHPVFNGCLVINGTWACSGAVDVNYDATIPTKPPTGFGASSKMLVAAGTYK